MPGIILIGMIVGLGLLAVTGGVENSIKKKRSKMTFDEFKKLKQQGRL